MSGDKTFICALCGGVFEKEVPEDEAIAEKERLFPGVPLSECELVCDDCFKKIGLQGAGL